MADTARPPVLGWPWDQLLDAARRAEGARQRLQAAGVLAGTVDTEKVRHPEGERSRALQEKLRAEFDLEGALADWRAVKAEMALQFLAGLRAAIEHEPTALRELLAQLPAAETVVEAIRELEDRVDAAEDAVVNLEQGRVVA